MIIKKIIQQYFKGLRAQVLFYPLMVVKNNRPRPRRPAKNFRPPLEVPRRILDPLLRNLCRILVPPFGNCEETATPHRNPPCILYTSHAADQRRGSYLGVGCKHKKKTHT